MLTTRQKTLRKFWYATVKLDDLRSGPKPFRLMGEDIVLFLDAAGQPAALSDRCCHRTARLSKGWCENGNIVCGYHGWTYDRSGQCIRIPQFPDNSAVSGNLKTTAYRCRSSFGYAWVALDEPLADLFEIPEDSNPAYRRIDQFYETWNCAPLRMLENSFDNAHFSFVHKATFGQFDQPKPEKYEMQETDYGFYAESIVPIANPPAAHRVTGTTEPTTTRHMRNHWYMPFCRRLDMEYPGGLRHIIFNCATPIDDDRIQLVQWLYRSDREEDCSTQELIDWDAAITKEDKDILEATDPDACIDISRRVEAHMPSDRGGIIMRKRLLELMRTHGEGEIHGGLPVTREIAAE
ncbi:aromatic ring-hydroxylating dioxygenase subunit alpha [Ferrovibrio terrae]|uniref:Aromatic ring-hydroxylating dioxygenase subunit alpha n=1 Tax=Ferrovibrio terrae TaxID=2594003 RepID=A0A516H202_9PROT|nr:aromatic ring-hydroxylating dioxygenase subunit alpha [Ferrovibrio terrae]QDO97610.1 aromatic ring-hydroxylating dioxygenase subunit alpha [Ferrovibrio terrae]